jgi:3-dehydroquinate synthase
MALHERCVKVSLADRSYDIVVGAGLLREVGSRLRGLGHSGKVALVTDSTVAPLYATTVRRSLKSAGYEPLTIVIPAGERAKTLKSAATIFNALTAARFERSSILLALGGGVIGDLTGFAAAIYMRGIPFVQIPTTLVAQVDSSVGGKTGVNHPRGKNLIGAFYQPRLVLIDPQTLGSLPLRQRVAGLAEVIKYGMIVDEAFFGYLEEHLEAILDMQEERLTDIVTRSCEIKASVVMEDEHESDRRRILNYGHTIGHALESLGNYRTLMHGEAVGIGMVQEASIARHLDICTHEAATRLRTLVARAGLRTELPAVTFGKLWSAMQHDKKVAHGRLYCIFPERVGRVRIAPLEHADCRQWFAKQRHRRSASA